MFLLLFPVPASFLFFLAFTCLFFGCCLFLLFPVCFLKGLFIFLPPIQNIKQIIFLVFHNKVLYKSNIHFLLAILCTGLMLICCWCFCLFVCVFFYLPSFKWGWIHPTLMFVSIQDGQMALQLCPLYRCCLNILLRSKAP